MPDQPEDSDSPEQQEPGKPPEETQSAGEQPAATPTYDIVAEAEQIAERAQTDTTPPDMNSVSEQAELERRPHAILSPGLSHPYRFRLLHNRRYARHHRRLFSDWHVGSMALLVLLLLSAAAPLGLLAGYSFDAYEAYTVMHMRATSGLQHLQDIKTLFSRSAPNPGSAFEESKLIKARQDFADANADFTAVETRLDQTELLHNLSDLLPRYRPQLISARAASQIGIDLSLIGEQAIDLLQILAPRLRSPLLSTAHTPLLTGADLTTIGKTIGNIEPLVDDIQLQAHLIDPTALPLNPHQYTQIQQLLHLIPQVALALHWGRTYLGALGWLLGVDNTRTFLVQTMDRAELRATGGFTGQYGELQISGARIAPFSLHDIALVEYADNSPTYGNLAPEAYRSWWPFANWGLRDSNLSADFPTSAQLAINTYHADLHRQVDGVILFTPLLIEHILRAIGPLHITHYNEIITAQNLEERLHYYQLDNAGIRREELIEHVEDPALARKLFTAALARTLMDQIRHAPSTMLLALAQELFYDLKTKDLQVYLTNPQLEGLLQQYGYAAQVDRSTTHDSLYIVQTNVSANKASQYVQTIAHDIVHLNAVGGAIHQLQLRLIYNQAGPVYGLDTYRDYIRIYVPPAAHFLWGDGFDTGNPLCGGPLGDCPAHDVYAHHELICAEGQYIAGASAPMLNDPYSGQWHPLDTVGPPTNFQSDVPGRAMFAGYAVIPKNCTLTMTLSWYVPPAEHAPYSLLVQRQAGTFPTLDLTVLPDAGGCIFAEGLHFHGTLTEDASFSSIPIPSLVHIIRNIPVTCTFT